jgi:hypothetical protein
VNLLRGFPTLFAALAGIAVLVTACHTPAIFVKDIPKHGCNPYAEHVCRGGGCCLLNWDCCGVQWSNEPAICQGDFCQDANEPPPADFGGPRTRRTMAQRRP